MENIYDCAYTEGYFAHLDGKSVTENPHEYDTDEHVSWEAGWIASNDEKSDGMYE